MILGCKTTVIPEGVTSIGEYAFGGCDSLSSIELPSGITSIGECAFWDCSSLSTINIPNSVTSIGEDAFWDCDLLVIKCNSNSYAHQYAINNDISYKLLDVDTTYTITYNLNGGKNAITNPTTYTEETETITLAAPTRSGYTFGGWYSDAAFTTKVTQITKGTTGDLTFYAKWNANKYTIKFNGNGSTSGSMANQTMTYGSGTKFTANAYKRKGYTFNSWNTKADGSGTKYANQADGSKVTTTNGRTVTLYAQWQAEKYTITYKLNGGTNSKSNPTSYYITTNTIKLANATRKGYSFAGWYSDKDCTKKVTQISKGSYGNKTLYAKWNANKYTIKFNGNGSTSGKTSSQKLSYGSSKKLTKNGFKRTGYTFKGWNTKKDGKGTSYKNKAEVKNLTSKSGGTVKLYAQWKKNTYTITYKLNGGTNKKKNPDNYTVTTSTIKLKNPTKKGYTFVGWYSDKKCTKKVTTIKKGSTGNKTLYAKWKKK